MSNKPREWWIEPHTLVQDGLIWDDFDPDAIHVIEKSAYDAVVEENDILKTDIMDLISKLDRRNDKALNYQAVVERLRELLAERHAAMEYREDLGACSEYIKAELAKVGVE